MPLGPCYEMPVSREAQAQALSEGRDAYKEQLARIRACQDHHIRMRLIGVLICAALFFAVFGSIIVLVALRQTS